MRKNPLQLIKYAVILIPIFSVVCMFATVSSLPGINQKIFLNNTSYDSYYSTEKNSDCYLSEGGVQGAEFFSNYYVANILMGDGKTIQELIGDNIYSEAENPNSEIANVGISYNIAANISVSLNDHVIVTVHDRDGSPNFIEGIVTKIYRPYYFDLLSNTYDESYGLCTLQTNDEFNPEEFNGTYLSMQSQLDGDESFIKANQYKSISTVSEIDIFTKAIIPLLSILLLVLVNYSNINYINKTGQKTTGLFIVLGSSPTTLFRAIFVCVMCVNIFSIIISLVIYKLLLFDIWLKQIVPLQVIAVLFIAMFVICFVCTFVCVHLQRKKFSEVTVLQSLSERVN